MGKGDDRRPTVISDEEFEMAWQRTFGEPAPKRPEPCDEEPGNSWPEDGTEDGGW